MRIMSSVALTQDERKQKNWFDQKRIEPFLVVTVLSSKKAPSHFMHLL